LLNVEKKCRIKIKSHGLLNMKIAMLLSGGVDSSVSLALLKEQAFDVTAFYLKIWLEDELSFLGDCPWQEDLRYVQAVCEQLRVPLEIVSFQDEYNKLIVSYVIGETKAGRTPNPDVLCNKQIKFGAFLDYIGSSFDKVASGHYAQVEKYDTFYALKSAPDQIKDQTYFLSQLSQQQLAKVMFPIGAFDKQMVRVLAEKYDLPNKNRPDSQGICFLGKLKFKEFLAHHLGKNPGDIKEFETEKTIGKQDGFWFHTIGQRQGLKLSGGPWFVVSKDTEKNIVYVSRTYYEKDKKRNSFLVSNINWIPAPQKNEGYFVKMRHGSHRYVCMVMQINEETYKITLDADDQGIATGQFAVFYQGEYCVGGGVICCE